MTRGVATDRATMCHHAMSRLLTILLILSIAATIAHAQQAVPPPFDDEFTSLSLHDVWRRGDNWQLVAPDTPRGPHVSWCAQAHHPRLCSAQHGSRGWPACAHSALT